jgi:hypothetical protein
MILGPKSVFPTAPLSPTILLGKLPRNLPFSLELPSATEVIGSITTPSEDEGSIYINVSRPLSETQPLLETEFAALGYRPLTDIPQWLPSPDFVSVFRLLCGSDPAIEVTVVLYEPVLDATNVQIHISNTRAGPCSAAEPAIATPQNTN